MTVSRLLGHGRPFAGLFALGLLLSPVRAAEPNACTDKLGKPVAFAGTTLDGKPFALDDARGKSATVVALLSFDCPVSNSYAPLLADLHAAGAARGVAVVGVVPGDDPAALAKQAAEFKLPFPLVHDPKLAVADALKASVTPEAFVLDRHGVVRYRGRIDNTWFARLKKNQQTTRHDLRTALDEVLADRPVTEPATVAVGCPVQRRETATTVAAGVPTYHRDVAPVLQARCQGCHRPGQVGPFSLMTYKQAVNWASDIKDYTADGRMPPWKPVGGPAYHNDRRMPAAEVRTLAAWVDADCPEGDPKDAPPPATFADGWMLGTPDLILTAPDDMHLAPSGRDLFRCYVLPTGLTEDKYVVGLEVKPGNPRVVHHTLNFFDTTGAARELQDEEAKRVKAADETDRGPGYSTAMGIGIERKIPQLAAAGKLKPGVPPMGGLGGWAPGQIGRYLPDGAGYLLPKGADIVIQVHYHRNGRAEKDRTQIGFYFAKKPVERTFQTLTIPGRFQRASAFGLLKGQLPVRGMIPAGDGHHVVKGAGYIDADCLIHNVMPHMHLLGKSVAVTMTPPGGEPVTLVAIKDWDYNWQETYTFKEPVRVKAGTKFEIEAVFDNSDKNPNNPFHPPQTVYEGEQTDNEMLFGFIGATGEKPGRVRLRAAPPKQ